MPIAPAQVIIHLVGLCVLTSPSADPGLKAILPRVAYVDPWTPNPNVMATARIGAVAPTAASVRQVKHVEDHVAMLVFETASYVGPTNLGLVKTLPGTYNAWSYVQLNGQRIQFSTGTATTPGVLQNGAQMPSMKALCGGTAPPLKSIYGPPYYPGAAAVVELPGSVNACATSSHKRIDSEIRLNGAGYLIITAGKRQLRLKAIGTRLNLIVANVPASCLSGHCKPPSPTAMNGLTHVHAYYDMLTNASTCTMSVTDWVATLVALPDACTMTAIPDAAGGVGMTATAYKQGGGGDETLVYNFECSNSQWP